MGLLAAIFLSAFCHAAATGDLQLRFVCDDNNTCPAKESMTLVVDHWLAVTLQLDGNFTRNESVVVSFTYQEELTGFRFHSKMEKPQDHQTKELITPLPLVHFTKSTRRVPVNLSCIRAGHLIVGVNTTDGDVVQLDDTFITLSLSHAKWLTTLSQVFGWMYFVVWTASFYPQLYDNWRRKSVVGLNFDFIIYNLIGFTCYTAYNSALFWNKDVQRVYLEENPRSTIPVALNDVLFSFNALIITALEVVQIAVYDRGDQKVSVTCMCISAGAIALLLVTCIPAGMGSISWVFYLTWFVSMVKLGSTLIKYIPQALMNFRRRSTTGWSILNVLADCTGGVGSLAQMFIDAYNYEDVMQVLGNPAKFGLGLFSVLFDILFIIQHYGLYTDRTPPEEKVPRMDTNFVDDDQEPLLSDDNEPDAVNYGAAAT